MVTEKIQDQKRRILKELGGEGKEQLSPLNYSLGMVYARRREKLGIQEEARRNPEHCEEKNWITSIKG